jgi:hypothetical protein
VGNHPGRDTAGPLAQAAVEQPGSDGRGDLCFVPSLGEFPPGSSDHAGISGAPEVVGERHCDQSPQSAPVAFLDYRGGGYSGEGNGGKLAGRRHFPDRIYLLLVGPKITVALLAGRFRDLLAGWGYRLIMRVLAVVLASFALLLLRDGLRQLALL